MKKIIITLILLFAAMPLWSIESKELEEIIESIIGSKQSISGNNKVPEESLPKRSAGTDKIIIGQDPVNNTSGITEEERNKTLSFPAADEALLKSGIQLFEASLFVNARQKLEELKSKYPESQYKDLASIWLSKILVEMKNYNDAISMLNSISQESGEFPAAVYYIADIHLRKGDDSGAIENYYRVASLFPDHELADDSYIAIAKIYLKNGKGSQAIESAIRVVKYYSKKETVDDAYFILAQVFEKDSVLKDFGIARAIYKIFLKKANAEKTPYFANSPLLDRVKSNLSHIENTYYNKAFIKSS
jgi:TolA-binding protein